MNRSTMTRNLRQFNLDYNPNSIIELQPLQLKSEIYIDLQAPYEMHAKWLFILVSQEKKGFLQKKIGHPNLLLIGSKNYNNKGKHNKPRPITTLEL